MTSCQGQRDKNKANVTIGGTRKCYVCDLNTIDKNTFVEHMDDHSEDLNTYKFSNNMSDCCKTVCKLCGKLFPLQQMRNHTKKDHGMKITEYKTKFHQFFFDIDEKVFHRCGICQLPLLLDCDAVSSHLASNKATHQLSHKEYSENFLQLVNNHRSTNPPQAKAKVAQNGTQSDNVTIYTYERMTQPTENRCILKQIENFPISAPKQHENLNTTKVVLFPQAKAEVMSLGEKPSNKEASFEDCAASETARDADNYSEGNEPMAECDSKNQEDNDNIDMSVDSVMSIEKFRFLISGLAGGDGTGYPDIENILARQPAREEEVMQAAREYCQGLAVERTLLMEEDTEEAARDTELG